MSGQLSNSDWKKLSRNQKRKALITFQGRQMSGIDYCRKVVLLLPEMKTVDGKLIDHDFYVRRIFMQDGTWGVSEYIKTLNEKLKQNAENNNK